MSQGAAPAPPQARNINDVLAGQSQPRRRRSRVKTAVMILLGLLPAALLAGVLAAGTGFRYEAVRQARLDAPADIPEDEAPLGKFVARQKKKQAQIESQLAKLAPRGVYIVVDQTQNRLYLKKDEQTLLEAQCSAGSGMVLQEAEGGKNRQWVFDTPRGLFKVKRRIENPVWSKPDWAFVEEGKPIPKNAEDRLDYGTLGEYALYLGDGYMIHGTLYTRLLGRSVTHGCIRLGAEDLRRVWAETTLGTPVYIY